MLIRLYSVSVWSQAIWVYVPDVNVTLSLRIVDRRKLDLAEDYGSIGRWGTADLDEVIADGERNEVVVGHSLRA